MTAVVLIAVLLALAGAFALAWWKHSKKAATIPMAQRAPVAVNGPPGEAQPTPSAAAAMLGGSAASAALSAGALGSNSSTSTAPSFPAPVPPRTTVDVDEMTDGISTGLGVS